MTHEELIGAGWRITLNGYARGCDLIFSHKDECESYHEAATVPLFNGRFSYRLEGRGQSPDAALRKLGECGMMDGRTVREWALSPAVAL